MRTILKNNPWCRSLAGVLLLLPGLAGPALAAGAGGCRDWLGAVDREIRAAGVRDAGAARVPGYPYLRSNRLLAALGREELDEAGRRAWVEQLLQLGLEGYRFELQNLPAAARKTLKQTAPAAADAPLWQTVETCSRALRRAELVPEAARRLRGRVSVPDNYRSWQRVLGLYGIVVLPFAWGVHSWHQETREVYALPLGRLEVAGRLVRYVPPPAPRGPELERAWRQMRRDALGIPRPDPSVRERLFALHAPVWVVDTVSEADRIGTPVWRPGEEAAQVDTSRPVVYRLLSHTRFEGEVLLQLNYVVWFPSRPRSSSLDLLGGHLDGITWRVTLDRDGRPLLYDAMHNCGCYHMFYPGERLQPLPPPHSLKEIAFSPQRAPAWSPDRRVVLRIAHRTHYLERVLLEDADAGTAGQPHAWGAYDTLRALPRPGGGSRSLFAENGIVAGSERGERFIFWPMGVPSPGAMRQWGNHATAFIGRRHFDDADLLPRYFVRVR